MKNTGAGGAFVLMIIIAIVGYVLINSNAVKQKTVDHVDAVREQISSAVSETRKTAGAAVAGRPAAVQSVPMLISKTTVKDIQGQRYSRADAVTDTFDSYYPDQGR